MESLPGSRAASFLLPPQPLTRNQRAALLAAALVVAVSRIWALSKTMWEWDEALFVLAVRDFDVVNHRPHPPGFPIYIGAAKLLRLLIDSDFRALQAVTLLGALLLFPAAFLLARELRFSFLTSLLASLLYVFAPNVWYYGGTAFSDIPATTAILAANAFLLRGCRDTRFYVAGCLLLGISLGIRPQLLLCAAAPWSLSTFVLWRRSRRAVVAGAAVVVTVVAIAYVSAALASRPRGEGFLEVMASQSNYVRTVDSYRNPGRPMLQRLVRSFFIRAIRAPREPVFFMGIFGLIAIGSSIPRRAANIWLLLLTFLPLNIFSWLMLDIGAAARYCVPYAVMYAILAAEGARLVASVLRSEAARTTAQTVLVLAIVARLVGWAWSSIQQVRTTPTPPASAMTWIAQHVDPAGSRLHVFEGLGPASDVYVSGHDRTFFAPLKPLPAVTFDRTHYYAIDQRSPYPEAVNFEYVRGPLFDFARARYFATSVLPLDALARFGAGWFDVEKTGGGAWRWMERRGEITLAPMQAPATLTLQYHVPSRAATVTVSFNGQIVSTQTVREGMNTTSVNVTPDAHRPNEAVIEIDRAFTPRAPDPRELGLQLFSWSWSPVPGTK